MTTNSFAYTIRSVKAKLAEVRPDLEITKYKQVKMGRIRLAQITLKTGEYRQFPMPALGTHHEAFSRAVLDEVISMRRIRLT